MDLNAIKNSKQGKTCLVFGNGYSLRNLNLDPLVEFDCFCSNWFCLHPLYKNFTNLTHAVSDKAFFSNGTEVSFEFLRNVFKNPNVKLLLNNEQKTEIQQALKGFSEKDISYLKYTREKTVWDGNFSDDLLSELYFGYTVVIDFILPTVSWMGYKNVFLLGVDCNYRLDMDENFNASYFFDPESLPNEILRHMHTQKLKKGSQSKLIEWNKGFKVVLEHFKSRNANIISVENQGSLTSLPTLDFQSFLKSVK